MAKNKEDVVDVKKAGVSETVSTGKKEQNSNTVDIDNKTYPEKVAEYDSEGKVLQFETKEGFPTLPEDVIRALSRDNKTRYFVAKGLHEQWLKYEKSNPRKEGPEIRVLGQLGQSARGKLKHHNPKPGWYQTWKRDDEYQEALEQGFRPVYREKKGGKGKEIGKVLDKGGESKAELIEVEIPQRLWDEHLSGVGERSKERLRSEKEMTKDRMSSVNKKLQIFDDSNY